MPRKWTICKKVHEKSPCDFCSLIFYIGSVAKYTRAKSLFREYDCWPVRRDKFTGVSVTNAF